MKSGIVLTFSFFVFLVLEPRLFAFGKKEVQEEKKPENPEWSLCITAFDTSAMSPVWHTAGDTAARSLASAIQNLSFRFRGVKESSYYSYNSWAKSRTAAAEAIVKKQNERDLLFFKGDPEWKYRKDLKTVEAAILGLREELAKVEAMVPEIEEKPVFKLSDKNKSGVFPVPPEPGREKLFCAEQKADAFLTGTLSEYYGRIYLVIKMYTRYSNSYSYEDFALFSSDDFNTALNEIGSRLAAAVSESYPSAVIVHVTPPEAMVLIDGVYAGQEEIEMQSRSPGQAEISVLADNYAPVSVPLELNAGELAELFVNLTPLGMSAFEAETPDNPGSKVYLGSLFVGETPLSLELPTNEFSYISVETAEGEVGSVIFKDNNVVKGRARFERKDDERGKADFYTTFPVTEEEKKVENARRSFYNFYGAFWIILPAALIASGIADTYPSTSANVSNIQRGATVAWVSSLGLTFYRIFRYLYASGGDSTPIVKVKSKGESE
jgi:hypothetical protein